MLFRSKGPLQASRAVAIARDVARALDHAHGQGVVHRDIKPSNILLSKTGQVKVIDFGLAVQIAHPKSESMYVEGTPKYLSPEQARGRAVDGRSDLYSLGVTLYEMLTGVCPFQGGTESSVIQKHLDERRPSIPVRKNGSLAPLAEILSKLLAVDPEARTGSARALADELNRFLVSRPALGPRKTFP